MPTVSSLRNRRARAALLWLCAALPALSCKPKLPDGVFVCAQDGDCPAGFTCREQVCRRGSAQTEGADASLPNAVTGESAGERAQVAGSQAGHGGDTGRGEPGAGRAGSQDAGGSKATLPPPPPPPFMPHTFVQLPAGRSMSAAGAALRSEHYRLWTSLGQSPGTGSPVRASSSYRLVGGIVGVLQAEQTP